MAATSSDSTSDQLVEKLRQLREGLSNRVIAAQAENERLSAEVAGLRKQLATAQRIADDANAKHPITQDDLDKVTAERDALKTKLDETMTANVAELAKRDAKIAELEKANTAVRADYKKLSQAIAEYNEFAKTIAATDDPDDTNCSDPDPAATAPPKKAPKEHRGAKDWMSRMLPGHRPADDNQNEKGGK